MKEQKHRWEREHLFTGILKLCTLFYNFIVFILFWHNFWYNKTATVVVIQNISLVSFLTKLQRKAFQINYCFYFTNNEKSSIKCFGEKINVYKMFKMEISLYTNNGATNHPKSGNLCEQKTGQSFNFGNLI